MKYNIYQCTAKYWQEKGISIVPLYHRSKTPHAQALIRSGLVKSNGKAAWLPLKNSLPTTDQIRTWFLPDTEYNLAVVTTDRFIVLDFDCPTEYAHWYCWQFENNPVVINTYVVTTSRGLHLYYRLGNPLTEKIKCQIPYEVKSHGRLITIPPSIHPSGTPYRATNSPNNILTVDSIKDVLTFSPVEIKRPVVKKSPWEVRLDSGPVERVNLLDLFPEARQTDDEGRYWITDCPFHGHRKNFMLDTVDNVGYCHAGCGSFLATKLIQMIGEKDYDNVQT